MNQAQNSNNNIIGKPIDRVDGYLKVTGGARYSAEIPTEKVVHAVLCQSTIARGRIRSIDTQAAERAPGVLAVITHLNAPRLAQLTWLPAGQSLPILQKPEIYYYGQNIGVVVATTLEQAEYAAALVRATYDEQQPVGMMAQWLNEAFLPPMGLSGGSGGPVDSRRGDVAQGLSGAVSIEQTYTTPIEHHNAMEPHATIALWEGDNLTVYDTTQNVSGVRQVLASAFGMRQENVRVVSRFLGGGFGSKGLNWPHTTIAAIAAQRVKRPVKLVLERPQMFTSAGHRAPTSQQITLGATRAGKLTAIRHATTSHTSMFDDFVEPCGLMTRMMYSCPNVEVSHRLVRANVGTPTFTRAPGEASGSFALESAIDELAYALNLDPIELRNRNYAERDEHENHPWSSKSLRETYRLGAERFGWSRRNPVPRSMRDGRYLIGYGVASATYPANYRAASARAVFFADGRALVQTGTHDLGTGTYTIMTQIAAETLGLPVDRVRFELGDTRLPPSPGAGGSASAASAGSAVQAAARSLRSRLIEMALRDENSPLFGLGTSAVTVESGRIFARDNRSRGDTYVQVLARLGEKVVEVVASAQPGRERATPGGAPANANQRPGTEQDRGTQAQESQSGVYSFHSFGAHFCEVRVDPDLGTVRVARLLGCYGVGRVLNLKTATSQMHGGMVWGIGMALHEETHMDTRGYYANANLGEYHLPVNADIPAIETYFVEENDQYVNPIGAKGIGEIGIVGVAAAIANAVYHATGKRVRDLPITMDKLI
jgi:xanthine dehydrogenase YagR molybdenum-binding subunit